MPGNSLDGSLGNQLGKAFKGTVVCPFDAVREAAGRQLPHRKMVTDAVAANAFARTRVIGAVAVLEILLFVAFHESCAPRRMGSDSLKRSTKVGELEWG
jgi:hypothetical protein